MNLQRLFDKIDGIIELLGKISVLLIIGCTSVNIALRWTIGRSIGELDEISLMAFVWTIYIGMGLLNNYNEHICMDFIVNRLPGKGRIVLTLADMVIELIISGAITYLAFKLMCKSWNRTLNVTHVPYSFMHLAILIGFALLMVSVLNKMAKLIWALKQGADPFAEEGEDQ